MSDTQTCLPHSLPNLPRTLWSMKKAGDTCQAAGSGPLFPALLSSPLTLFSILYDQNLQNLNTLQNHIGWLVSVEDQAFREVLSIYAHAHTHSARFKYQSSRSGKEYFLERNSACNKPLQRWLSWVICQIILLQNYAEKSSAGLCFNSPCTFWTCEISRFLLYCHYFPFFLFPILPSYTSVLGYGPSHTPKFTTCSGNQFK